MPYHDNGSKDTDGKEDQQQFQQEQQQEQQEQQQEQQEQQQEQSLNPIVQVNLNASPGEMMFQITGEEYEYINLEIKNELTPEVWLKKEL